MTHIFPKMTMRLRMTPKECKRIAEGKKTVVILKQKPLSDVPFNVEIWCMNDTMASGLIRNFGTFTCDTVEEYEAELVDDDCYEDIRRKVVSEDTDEEDDYVLETSNEYDSIDDCPICKDACVSFNEIKQYLYDGKPGFYKFYGLHISELTIYK